MWFLILPISMLVAISAVAVGAHRSARVAAGDPPVLHASGFDWRVIATPPPPLPKLIGGAVGAAIPLGLGTSLYAAWYWLMLSIAVDPAAAAWGALALGGAGLFGVALVALALLPRILGRAWTVRATLDRLVVERPARSPEAIALTDIRSVVRVGGTLIVRHGGGELWIPAPGHPHEELERVEEWLSVAAERATPADAPEPPPELQALRRGAHRAARASEEG